MNDKVEVLTPVHFYLSIVAFYNWNDNGDKSKVVCITEDNDLAIDTPNGTTRVEFCPLEIIKQTDLKIDSGEVNKLYFQYLGAAITK